MADDKSDANHNTMQAIKLFCFPFAGGTARFYSPWEEQLKPGVDLRAMELAGRGRRITEPMYEDMKALLQDLLDSIRPELFQGPYAFFGHSMGGLIAYELALMIKEQGLPAPKHIFFSGRCAPGIERKRTIYHQLSDEDFKEEVMKLGAAPREIFEEPELANLFLPILRNDFRVSETHTYSKEITALEYDISVLVGKGEPYTEHEIASWHHHTQKRCSIHYFPGGHFFINQHKDWILQYITKTLMVNSMARGVVRGI